MKNSNHAPPSVYDVYEAVEKCVRAYHAASQVALPYHNLNERDGRYAGLMKQLDDATADLQKHIRALKRRVPKAKKLIAGIKRDIHRACAHRDLVEWGETTASSVGEAVVALCGKVLEHEWNRASLELRNEVANQRVLLRREPMNLERVTAMLNLEAARVVELQERMGPDLSLLSGLEQRIYAAVLLDGPIDEAGLNQRLYGHPKKGDSRKTAGPMAKHGILVQTAQGYMVRKPGTLSGQT